MGAKEESYPKRKWERLEARRAVGKEMRILSLLSPRPYRYLQVNIA